MKTSSLHQLMNGLSFVILVVMTSGCATPALWKNTAAHDWKPSSPEQLLVMDTTNQQVEVAVLFSQFVALKKTHQYRPVAWCLSQSPTNLVIGVNAVTRFTNSITTSRTMPLFIDNTGTAAVSSAPPGYAVWSFANHDLTVHLDGYPTGPFTLPTTHEQRRTAERVLLLPFALCGDAAITAGALICIGASGPH